MWDPHPLGLIHDAYYKNALPDFTITISYLQNTFSHLDELDNYEER